jgi:transposase-like protein
VITASVGAVESFQSATRAFQRRLVSEVLETAEWNVTEAARRLDLTRSHLYNLIREFELQRPALTGHALRGGKLRLTFANDAGTYVVGLPEIRALTAVQDRGEPFPWEALARLEPEEDGPPEPPRRVGSSSPRR